MNTPDITENITRTAKLYRELYPNSDVPVRVLLPFFMRGLYPKTDSYKEFIQMYR